MYITTSRCDEHPTTMNGMETDEYPINTSMCPAEDQGPNNNDLHKIESSSNFLERLYEEELMKKAQTAPYARNGGTEYAEQEGQLNDEIILDQETHIPVADDAIEAPMNYAVTDSSSTQILERLYEEALMKKAQSAPYARNGGIEYAEHEGQLNDEIIPDQETHISIVGEAIEAPVNYAATDSNSEHDQNTDITEEDIQIFKHNESVEATITLSQEGESQHVPRIDMQFESSDEAHEFYNNYALIVGFSIVMAHNYHSRDKKMMGQVTRMTLKCQ
jgi:uncharacterized protein YciI